MTELKAIDVAEMTQIEGGLAPLLVFGAKAILSGFALTTGVAVGCMVFCK